MSGMSASVRTRLSAMMFLQFFIWGAWFVTLGTYLGLGLSYPAVDIATIYSTMPWGAIAAPFIFGVIADRYFRAERVLAVLHLAGAALLWHASSVTDSSMLFWVLLGYALCYTPTLALVTAISFNQMTEPGKEFPWVRVFGTAGWIVAGLGVGFAGVEATEIPLRVAAGASVLLGVFALVLPKTPPSAAAERKSVVQAFGLDALGLLKNVNFSVFIAASLLICIPLAFYYNFTNLFLNEVGVDNAAGKMTLGQMSEVAFMLVMPFFFARLGVKWMLLIGMAAWAARYLLFAYGDPGASVWMLYGGILLHGVCYDFFFVTGQIYTDRAAPAHLRASAQGFITLITYGVGMLIGTAVSGLVVSSYETQAEAALAVHDWTAIWLIPAAMAAAVGFLFVLCFRSEKTGQAASAQTPNA
jgi:nucleoside transporter